MNVLVACEYSGVVREAFRLRGHYALSNDLLPADDIRLIEEEVDTFFYHDNGCNIKVIKDDETLFTHGINFKTKLEVVK